MHRALVFWFTGLSGSGKSTIAYGMRDRLTASGYIVRVLDGDEIRERNHRHLGFSLEDIQENNRLIAQRCAEIRVDADVILVPIISPYAASRAAARKLLAPGFFEMYCSAPLAEVVRRDTKGLYGRAARGALTNCIGYSPGSPYEPPRAPDLTLATGTEPASASIATFDAFVHRALHAIRQEYSGERNDRV